MHSFEDDNELDHVAKRAAEAFDAPGMANWDKMQLLLEQEMPLDKPKNRFFWVLIPALLLLGMGGLWWYVQENQQATNSNKDLPTQSNHSNTVSLPKAAIEKQANETTTFAITSNKKNSIIVSKKYATIQQKESNSSLLNQMGMAEGPIDQIIAEQKEQRSNSNKTANELGAASTNAETQENQSLASTSNKLAEDILQPEIKHINSATVSQNNSIVVSNKNKSEKGFFIGLTAGVDASTVHFNYKEDLGYNIGGIIGYRFNQYFSIKTGGIYTQKNYKMNGVDFHPPKGTWVSYFKMETVTGTCDMWDIPLMGTYHFKYNGKGNYFASLGTSSYFMKRENYSYLYYVNNQTYNRSASYPSTDQHLFALVHISGGIEKPMGKHLTGIIEPYAKIPLGGVGFGNIELSSFGVNFSLTYKQPKRK